MKFIFILGVVLYIYPLKICYNWWRIFIVSNLIGDCIFCSQNHGILLRVTKLQGFKIRTCLYSMRICCYAFTTRRSIIACTYLWCLLYMCNSWYYSAKQYSYGRIEEKISCTLGILEKKNSGAMNLLCSVIFLYCYEHKSQLLDINHSG